MYFTIHFSSGYFTSSRQSGRQHAQGVLDNAQTALFCFFRWSHLYWTWGSCHLFAIYLLINLKCLTWRRHHKWQAVLLGAASNAGMHSSKGIIQVKPHPNEYSGSTAGPCLGRADPAWVVTKDAAGWFKVDTIVLSSNNNKFRQSLWKQHPLTHKGKKKGLQSYFRLKFYWMLVSHWALRGEFFRGERGKNKRGSGETLESVSELKWN